MKSVPGSAAWGRASFHASFQSCLVQCELPPSSQALTTFSFFTTCRAKLPAKLKLELISQGPVGVVHGSFFV
jgi:hypothetical protein